MSRSSSNRCRTVRRRFMRSNSSSSTPATLLKSIAYDLLLSGAVHLADVEGGFLHAPPAFPSRTLAASSVGRTAFGVPGCWSAGAATVAPPAMKTRSHPHSTVSMGGRSSQRRLPNRRLIGPRSCRSGATRSLAARGRPPSPFLGLRIRAHGPPRTRASRPRTRRRPHRPTG